MADGVTDPLEKAVLSGAIFAGPDPDGPEPRRSADSDDEDDEDSGDVQRHDGPSATDIQTGPAQAVHTTKGASHNTGVKGVLADYRNREQASGPTATRNRFGGLSIGKSAARRREESATSASALSASELSGGELSDSDIAAQEAYRSKRIEEMKRMGGAERRQGGSDTRETKFGHLKEVGQAQFIKAIEDRSAECVIVHVFDSNVPACVALNVQLASLARRYPHTKFLRAHARELEFATGNENDVLPTLLVYRHGEMCRNLVAFDKELVSDLGLDANEDDEDHYITARITPDAVEQTLIRHQVLQPTAAVNAGDYTDEDSE